jgi:hypothetical protein
MASAMRIIAPRASIIRFTWAAAVAKLASAAVVEV